MTKPTLEQACGTATASGMARRAVRALTIASCIAFVHSLQATTARPPVRFSAVRAATRLSVADMEAVQDEVTAVASSQVPQKGLAVTSARIGTHFLRVVERNHEHTCTQSNLFHLARNRSKFSNPLTVRSGQPASRAPAGIHRGRRVARNVTIRRGRPASSLLRMARFRGGALHSLRHRNTRLHRPERHYILSAGARGERDG